MQQNRTLLFLSLFLYAHSSYATFGKWTKALEELDYKTCYILTASSHFSAEEKKEMHSKIEEEIRTLKQQHKPVFLKKIDQDLLVFHSMKWTGFLSIGALSYKLVVNLHKAYNIRQVLNYLKQHPTYTFNSPDIEKLLPKYENQEKYNRALMASIVSAIGLGVLACGMKKFYTKYHTSFEILNRINWLNDIKYALEQQNTVENFVYTRG